MSIQDLLARLDDDALSGFFSNNALQRARTYIGRVGAIEMAGNTLRANVQGSARAPYRTVVRLEARSFLGEPSVEIDAACTCPVGHSCKHAAALILAARRPGALVERPRAEVIEWAKKLGGRLKREATKRPASKKPQYAIFYALTGTNIDAAWQLTLFKARVGPQGQFTGHGDRWYNHEQALVKPPSFTDEADLSVFRALRRLGRDSAYHLIRFQGAHGAQLLDALVETGRGYLAADEHHPLRPLARGDERDPKVSWEPGPDGLAARVRTEPGGARVLPTEPLRYLDGDAAQVGALRCAQPAPLLALMELPPLNSAEVALVSEALAEAAPALPTPAARGTRVPVIDCAPQPVLTLDTLSAWAMEAHRDYPRQGYTPYDFALAGFRYEDVRLSAGSEDTLLTRPDGSAVRLVRDVRAEKDALDVLRQAGFAPVPTRKVSAYPPLPSGAMGLASEAAWMRFFAEQAPALKAAGWQIDCPPDFRHLTLTVDDWVAELDEGDSGWFELTLGIVVDGQRLDLAPLLHHLFRQDPRWQDTAALATIDDETPITLHTPEGARVLVPAGRIKPLATALIDLFDGPTGGARPLSTLDAPRLAEALDEDWQREGFTALEAWRERLAGIASVRAVTPPDGLRLDLRPYQLDGLAWLQHLRAHDLGGVLADDMGLGKTAQTLAHLLLEKEQGRLDRPSLVVLPTSLVFNWQREAQRFAPALRVLKLHGPDRAERFATIAEHDVCLTTYPLLWRDIEMLETHDYHLLILDEAQTVKNASSQAAKAVRRLRGRHRLCLTGTPLENHLGELWSQFDFLLPGFLGTSRDFTQRWRTPIEKRGDGVRRELLARRIAPFVLRRKKDQVAAELPPKSEFIRRVELTGKQRDLYETVRVTMDKRLREAIAERGLARSHVQILDALLKLRQVCCDARLLKTPAAQRVKERAKLDLLMQMLPELVDEGRRILVFSQFTEMLALIGAELDERSIDYVKLTGQTRDREAVVGRFQAAEVPVFLISLKAGGVGLNLTAADTVIHFDPWWNPAAENQATDRAHRIGQDKPVFVYKLVVEGSIEEKILDMQARKADLAEGVLGGEATGLARFDAEDLSHLLAPLPT